MRLVENYKSIILHDLLTALIIALFVFVATVAFAYTKGTVDFIMTDSSVTQTENLGCKLNVSVTQQNSKSELDFALHKEQTEEERTQFNVKAKAEYDLLITKKIFAGVVFKYDRDMGYKIADSTSFGFVVGIFPGLKIKDAVVKGFDAAIQTGLFLNTTYLNDNSYDRKTLWNLSGEGEYKKGKYGVFAEFDADLNLDEVHALDSVFNDYNSAINGGVKAEIGPGTSLKLVYNWKHNHTAEIEDQRLKMVVLEVKF